VFLCHSFLPDNPANLNAAEFCNQRIDLWTRIDHEIVGQAPWVPVYNPRSLVMLSGRVGNYQFDPYWSVLIDQLWVR